MKVIWSAAEEQAMIDAYRRGEFFNKIVKRSGKNWRTVRKVFTRHGIFVERGTTRCPAIVRKHPLDTNFFETIDTENKAYWLGFLCAECHLPRQGYSVEVGLAVRDEGHLAKLNAAVGSDYTIRPKNSGLAKPGRSLQLCSKKMAADLVRHGVVRRGLRRRPPRELPPDLWRHYWRGLFDGDGGISFDSNSQWCMALCGTKPCVGRFAQFARGVCGTRAKMTGPKSKIYYLVITGNRMNKLLAEALYGSATMFLDRKMRQVESIMKTKTAPLPRTITCRGRTLTIRGWARRLRVTGEAIRRRLSLGWSDEAAVGTPFDGRPRRPR